MKTLAIASAITLGLFACVSGGQNSLAIPNNLDLIEENHAEISKQDGIYVLDSYIIPFQRPYYITVKRTDGAAITKEEAETIAAEYIEPRGCTTPIERRPDLDRHNRQQTEWMIGIAC